MRQKQPLLTIVVLICSIIAIACTKEEQPTASFSVSDENPYVNSTVYFYDYSTNAYSYQWSFGDGETSTSTNPSHSYSSSGTYTVTLTVYSEKGKKSDTQSKTITVKEKTGDVMFWTDASTTYTITVTFRGTDKNITKYYTSTPSNCGATGCATYYNIPKGTYSFYAENLLYYWSGTITVQSDVCNKMMLYHSKAMKKENPSVPTDCDKLVPGESY